MNKILDEFGLQNYDDVEKTLNDENMTLNKFKSCLNKVLKNAKKEKRRLNGFQTDAVKKFSSGEISKTEMEMKIEGIKIIRKH